MFFLGDFITIPGCGPPSPGAAVDISVVLHNPDFNHLLSCHYDNQGLYLKTSALPHDLHPTFLGWCLSWEPPILTGLYW